MFSVADGQVRELDTAAHLSPNAILEKYGGASGLAWAGEGAHQLADTLRARAETRNASFEDSSPGRTIGSVAPRTDRLAISIAALALNAYRSGRTVSPNELRAVYVRASDAEINEKCTK
jgi:tRNA A37 threonylcarbamoyladenosine modification protein TsaB